MRFNDGSCVPHPGLFDKVVHTLQFADRWLRRRIHFNQVHVYLFRLLKGLCYGQDLMVPIRKHKANLRGSDGIVNAHLQWCPAPQIPTCRLTIHWSGLLIDMEVWPRQWPLLLTDMEIWPR